LPGNAADDGIAHVPSVHRNVAVGHATENCNAEGSNGNVRNSEPDSCGGHTINVDRGSAQPAVQACRDDPDNPDEGAGARLYAADVCRNVARHDARVVDVEKARCGNADTTNRNLGSNRPDSECRVGHCDGARADL
jgi:hypothetical protein